MQQITNLADEADQITKLVLDDGSIVNFEFIYLPAIERWFFNVSHSTITLNSENLCVGPNILRQYRNNIPFGLFCNSTDGADPFDIEDFQNGRVAVFVLNQTEVAQTELAFFGSGAVAY